MRHKYQSRHLATTTALRLYALPASGFRNQENSHSPCYSPRPQLPRWPIAAAGQLILLMHMLPTHLSGAGGRTPGPLVLDFLVAARSDVSRLTSQAPMVTLS